MNTNRASKSPFPPFHHIYIADLPVEASPCLYNTTTYKSNLQLEREKEPIGGAD